MINDVMAQVRCLTLRNKYASVDSLIYIRSPDDKDKTWKANSPFDIEKNVCIDHTNKGLL